MRIRQADNHELQIERQRQNRPWFHAVCERIHGCARVDVAPGLEAWGDGRCWPSLGYVGPDAGLHKVFGWPARRTCA